MLSGRAAYVGLIVPAEGRVAGEVAVREITRKRGEVLRERVQIARANVDVRLRKATDVDWVVELDAGA